MNEVDAEIEGYVPAAEACTLSGFSMPQLRNLVSAGVVRTQRAKRGVQVYCLEDLQRLEGGPREAQPDDDAPSLILEVRAISEAYKQMLTLALAQTKQAQDHERALVTAFSKPLEQLGTGSRELLTAVLDQNKQLVERAAAGDAARLDFVKAAETMLKDQRIELREQLEADRKHALKQEVWEGVKKAAPHLLEGFKKTVGVDERMAAAVKLKEKLDPAKLAAILHFKLLDDEEIDLLCKAFDLNRAELEALNVEATETAVAEEKAAE